MSFTQIVKGVFDHLGYDIRRKVSNDLPYIQTIECAGQQFSFWITNEHTREWWGHSTVWISGETAELNRMCASDSVVFEVGAHHGFFTLLMSKWTGPNGKVFAFEANSENALVLGANLSLNDVHNVVCQLGAVGDGTAPVAMHGESVARAGELGKATTQLTLDDYCDSVGVSRCDLLKIDVEGFEGSVLRGARRLLESTPKIDLEIHLDDLGRYGDSVERVLGELPLDRYTGRMLVRPDYTNFIPWNGRETLPKAGVVNLFLWPKD